jgi:hypothetical protein
MSSVPPCDLTILAARRTTAVQLLDVLRDWSTLGLIGPLHLVDMDAVRPGELLVPATVLDGGRTSPVVLQDECAGRSRTDLVRIVAITEVGKTFAGIQDGEALALLNTVRSSLPAVEVVPLHLIGLALQAAQVAEDVAWLGWHNVVLAPENSLAPGQGASPIVYNATDPVRLTHLAAAVCSLGGLWAAQPSGPLDKRSLAPGRSLVAARTFTRHLSAEAVETELLSRLASVEYGYPVPTFEGNAVWVVADELGAASDMAEALLTKHAYVLPRVRRAPPRTPAKRIGALEALRMLFAFMWQALRNAPRAFLDAAIRKVSASTAAFVGGAVFGSGDTEYAVIVNGVRADGTPASWPEIDEALEASAARTGVVINALSNTDLSALWRDYVGGGLTLLDAGKRSAELPPRTDGGRRGIVTTAGRVAPDPTETFTAPEGVTAYVKDHTVSASDVLAARALDTRLAHVVEQYPHEAGQVHAARAALKEWFGERERSYTGRVGFRLARGISETRDEIGRLTQMLQSAQQASDVPSEIEQQQRSLALKLRLVFAGALLVAVVTLVAYKLGVLSVLPLIGILAAVLVGWLATSLIVFIRGQRDLFALLHMRRELAGQIELLRQHLTEAIDDMRRLSRAYRQYLDWTKAFGRFVQAPLGNPVRKADNEPLLGSGFPRNHRFGSARPEEPMLDEAAAQMKKDLFSVGWTSNAWEAFLDDVPREIGQDAFRIREDADLLWSDPGVSRTSLLTTWSNRVSERLEWRGATDRLSSRVRELLAGSDADLAPQLLANVQTRSGSSGSTESVTYDNFMNRLDSEATMTAPHQSFDRAMFADTTQNSEPWQVAETVLTSSSADLGRTIVVTQLSQGFNSYDMRNGSPEPADPLVGQPLVAEPATSPLRPVI